MATKLAQSQLAELPERVGILETKVENLNEKIGEVKDDIKEMHDCLDRTRDSIMAELDKMQCEYRANSTKFFEHADKLHAEDVETHTKLSGRLTDLEKIKAKYTMYAMAIIAFLVGAGVLGHKDLPALLKFVGLG